MSPNPNPPLLFHGVAIVFAFFFFFFFVFLPTVASLPLSTVAISRLTNATIVCAFLPGLESDNNLTCTALPKRIQLLYPSGRYPYSAIAAGDGYLCALSNDDSRSVMRWWDFTKRSVPRSAISAAPAPAPAPTAPEAKRVYHGPRIADLSAGDYHVCGLISAGIHCWRWPGLSFPSGMTFSDLAVGADFACGLVHGTGEIKCVGNGTGVVGSEPPGQHTTLAAGSHHACAVSETGKLTCWGSGAPSWVGDLPTEISSLALGENKSCVLRINGTLVCWGSNADPPTKYADSQFVSIQAKGDSICGILMATYSLICWGNKNFKDAHKVFDRVLPGPCAGMSSCSCGILPGSGNLCSNSQVVCHPCNLDAKGSPPTTKGWRKTVIFVIVGAVGVGIGLVAVALFSASYYKSRERRESEAGRLRIHADPGVPGRGRGQGRGRGRGESPAIEQRLTAIIGKGPSGTVEQFPLRILLDATANFAEAQKIGCGSFGSVYHAVLPDGREVAIKRAESNPRSSAAAAAACTAASTSAVPARRHRDRDAAFLSELALLSRVNHRNLVRLFGFCIESAERVLVYEFMANGNLHDQLHKNAQTPPPLTTWHARLKLALDAARGIEYLHSYAVPPIIHRDIKSSNILLDECWTAKVSDFGLSLLNIGEDKDEDDDGQDEDEIELPRTAGTLGYMDPEYYRLQHLTAKSDVYSFGVVLLELLSGCRVIQRYEESGTPRNVVEFAVPAIESDDIHRVLDPRLPPPTPSEVEAVAFVGALAADCVCQVGRDRPTMSEVVGGLERAVAACAPTTAAGPSVSRSVTATLTPAGSEKFNF